MFIWTRILSVTWGSNAPFFLFAAPAEDNAAQGVPADQAASQYWTNHITFSSKQSHIHHVCINMTVAAPGGRNTARSASNNPLCCTGPQALWVRFVITAARVSLWRKSPNHHFFLFLIYFFFYFYFFGPWRHDGTHIRTAELSRFRNSRINQGSLQQWHNCSKS